MITDIVGSSDAKATLKAYVHSNEQSADIPASPVENLVSQFILQFTEQYETTRRYLGEKVEAWTEEPRSFFGDPQSSSPSRNNVSVQRLFSWLDDLDDGTILPRIRRRLGLASFARLRDMIQKRLELVRMDKHETYKSFAFDILFKNIRQSGISGDKINAARNNLLNRLRKGGRYSRFPNGMLIAFGSVKDRIVLV